MVEGIFADMNNNNNNNDKSDPGLRVFVGQDMDSMCVLQAVCGAQVDIDNGYARGGGGGVCHIRDDKDQPSPALFVIGTDGHANLAHGDSPLPQWQTYEQVKAEFRRFLPVNYIWPNCTKMSVTVDSTHSDQL